MTASRHWAARYIGDQTIDLARVQGGEPGVGEVELAPAFVGICGTDLHILAGDMDGRVTPPAIIGHEVSATVTRVGPDSGRWQPGDAVVVVPLRPDGTCPACTAGHEHVCEHLDFLGIDSAGGLQARWVVPAATLVALPAALDLRTAALIEPAAVAVHDVRRAGLVPGQTAAVVGSGPVGLLIALVARLEGVDVVVVEPDPFRRAIAGGLGFATADPAAVDVGAELRDRTGGAGADVAFEVSGTQPGLDTAVAVLKVRGRLCQVGIHARPRTVDLHRFFWRELELVGARLYARDDVVRAVQLVEQGDLPVDRLISRVVTLPEAKGAFDLLSGGGGVMKVLVDVQAVPAAVESMPAAAGEAR